MSIDSTIKDIDINIMGNIELLDIKWRWFVAQNILAQTRNLLQTIFLKIYCSETNQVLDYSSYDNLDIATKYIHKKWNFKLFSTFYKFITISSSHYTESPEDSERLLVKYIPYFHKLKKFMKKEFDIDILENLYKIVNNKNDSQQKYYDSIAKIIINPYKNSPNVDLSSERYYIQKIKPFFSWNELFYEVTFCRASDNTSKFERIIAFTNLNILDNYAVKFQLINAQINLNGLNIPILIISSWQLSIRPCEFVNFWKIFGNSNKINHSKWITSLMVYLSDNNLHFVDIMNLEHSDFMDFYNKFMDFKDSNLSYFLKSFKQAYDIIHENKNGSNILRYLLFKMNNKIIKLQYGDSNDRLSGLNLTYSAIPFDVMPFCTSLKEHNPKYTDLIECINIDDRENEFFAKSIMNNIEQKWILFTEKNNDNEVVLLNKYNDKIYFKHKAERELIFKYNYFYLRWYVDTTIEIIRALEKFSYEWVLRYKEAMELWLNSEYAKNIDDDRKRDILLKMFENSRIACLYWPAWTGKTTILNYISEFFKDSKIIFLANTHPAVDNIKRRINYANDTNCKTIRAFLSSKNTDTDYDILVVDESSTVSNRDMLKILQKINTKLIILVWDTYQIEAIQFGNWFSVIKDFINKNSIHELINTYRTANNNLLNLWNKVRKNEDDITEHLVKNNYSDILTDKIFHNFQQNEIILCLNYDGFYWVNNINRILQANNSNESVPWWTQLYKKNDPILFNEIANQRFDWILFNNLKWLIREINTNNDHINFKIEVDTEIKWTKFLLQNDLKIVDLYNGKTLVEFEVQKSLSTDDDNDNIYQEIPFQIAYAISIHKSQWLEYDSVKIIISDEIWEQINHNIFYTAITRSKKDLKIYWSPETQNNVINNFKIINDRKNISLLGKIINNQ